MPMTPEELALAAAARRCAQQCGAPPTQPGSPPVAADCWLGTGELPAFESLSLPNPFTSGNHLN